jgi:hypothetical protein
MRLLALSLVLVSSLAAADPATIANDRAASAAKVYAGLQAKGGTASAEDLYRWSVRWLDAQLDAQPKTAAKALADHQKRMAELLTTEQARNKASLADANEVEMANYFKLEADLWVARGKK